LEISIGENGKHPSYPLLACALNAIARHGSGVKLIGCVPRTLICQDEVVGGRCLAAHTPLRPLAVCTQPERMVWHSPVRLVETYFYCTSTVGEWYGSVLQEHILLLLASHVLCVPILLTPSPRKSL
jgi:hypothetical protein